MDFNSYFATIEHQLPDLRNSPEAIVPSLTDYTCAIAASKKLGIKTGTMILEAKKCPELICIQADQKNTYTIIIN